MWFLADLGYTSSTTMLISPYQPSWSRCTHGNQKASLMVQSELSPPPIKGSQQSGTKKYVEGTQLAGAFPSISSSPRHKDLSIHSWYSSVMAFPDHLVESILDSFCPVRGDVFFDPHCGSGTALVEAQRRGLDSFGIDANPSSVLASQVKTNWSIDLSDVQHFVELMDREADSLEVSKDDPIVSYLHSSGMIERGWISEMAACRSAAIKRWIDRKIHGGPIWRFFMLALVSSIVRDISNVKFGPELYCVSTPDEPPDIALCVSARLDAMVRDLATLCVSTKSARVRLGDSRDGRTLRTAVNWSKSPAFVVTSPPYPTEHDYTRNSRLELVFLEAVTNRKTLRQIKKRMIRSHSKGIYVGDRDGDLVARFEPVQKIRAQVESGIRGHTSGFEGQYPKVVLNYFGGMLRHFQVMSRYLKSGSKLAYVVGDECSYKGILIPTAEILAEMIETYSMGLKLDEVRTWRSRRSKGDRKPLNEHIVLMTMD